MTQAPRRFTPVARKQNPMLASRNKMKLGLFGINADCGCAITTAPERHMGDDWATMMAVCQTADRAGFESLIPVGRWRGFGGESDFNGIAFETYTWAAGLAAVTDQIAVVTTSHVPTVHPLFAAKQAATIDHISGGRFGLNIICGWFGPEMKMFGGTMMEHETRYAYADQWIEIVQKAWHDPGYFDYKSEFFNLTQAFSEPKPLNRPVLINAGGSPRGKRYCAQHCDVAFVILNQSDPDTTRRQIQSYRDIAADYGKDIQVWCYSYCVQRDSLAEANRYLDYYVNQRGDDVACNNITDQVGIQTGIFTPEEAERFRFHFKAGWAGVPLVGTPAMIVEQFQTYSDLGVDGICLSWLDYQSGIDDFIAGVLPLLEQAGLREKYIPAIG